MMDLPLDFEPACDSEQAPVRRFAPKIESNKPNGAKPKIVIEAEQLSVQYPGHRALSDIDLAMPAKAITAIIGPSGCGKTSFLNCLNRMTDLIAHCKVTGKVLFDQINIFTPGYDVTTLRRRVGMIFQKPNPFPLSIRKNLRLPLMEHGVRDRSRIDHIIETSLLSVGLWHEVKNRLDKPALQLSGGQQQRLCLARALVLQPEVILLDEPCSALDPLSSALVEDLITQLREHYSIVIVTHNLAQAKRIADYTALFWTQNKAGRLIEFGATEALFNCPQHELTKAYVSGAHG